ncbi:serine/threonine-protein kinase [Streptomyces cremeus]
MSLAADDPQVVGEYRILGRLGTGGMGTVFLARSASGREVAVKVIHEQYSADPDFRARFKREIAAARQVSGAFTASVVDADADAARPWMATQYVPGPTLAQLLEEQGPLGDAELRLLALGLVEALRDIHRVGVVHRDLKPANVLMAADGPRVIDFGVSRAVGNAPLTVTGNVMGTPPFMSPEQLNSPRSVGPASDVFSLATLLVYAAAGRGPFDSDSPFMTAYAVVHEPPVLDGVREPLRGILEYCLVKEPDERPDLAELAGLLRKWRPAGSESGGGGGTAAAGDPDTMVVRRRGEAHSPAPPRARRVRVAALAGLLLAAGAGGLLLLLPDAKDARGAGGAEGGVAVQSSSGARAPLRSGERLPTGWRSWQAVLPPATVGTTGPVEAVRCTADGAVAVHCGGGSVRTVRLDAATGTVLWRAPQPPTASGTRGAGDSSPSQLAGGKAVFVVETLSDAAHRLVALDSRDGRRLWHRPVGRPAAAREPAVLGGLVAAPSADLRAVVARDTATGDARWTSPNPAGLACVPYEIEGVLYGTCSDPGKEDGPRTYVRYASGSGGRTTVTEQAADRDRLGLSGGPVGSSRSGRGRRTPAGTRITRAVTPVSSWSIPRARGPRARSGSPVRRRGGRCCGATRCTSCTTGGRSRRTTRAAGGRAGRGTPGCAGSACRRRTRRVRRCTCPA